MKVSIIIYRKEMKKKYLPMLFEDIKPNIPTSKY